MLDWRGALETAGPWDESERAGPLDVSMPGDEGSTKARQANDDEV